MYQPHLTSYLVIACWLAWIAYWVFLWKKHKPEIGKQNDREVLAYMKFLLPGFILTLADTSNIPGLRFSPIHYTPVIAAVGAAMTAVGVLLTLWSRHVLSDNWSSKVVLKKSQELITNGPYRLSRHPIYTGLSLMFLGTAIVQNTLAAYVGFLLAFYSFWVKLKQEEIMMDAHFKGSYAAYSRRTKRIIPYIL